MTILAIVIIKPNPPKSDDINPIPNSIREYINAIKIAVFHLPFKDSLASFLAMH